MNTFKTLLIETELKNAISQVIAEQNNFEDKEVTKKNGSKAIQTAKTQGTILFNSQLKQSGISYYISEYYYKEHPNAGLMLIIDANFNAIETGLMQLIETAKQNLSIVSPIDKPITSINIFGVNNNTVAVKPSLFETGAKNSVFSELSQEISKTAKLAPQIIAENCINDNSHLTAENYTILNNMVRKSNEVKTALQMTNEYLVSQMTK
jgi:hypothetical protein